MSRRAVVAGFGLLALLLSASVGIGAFAIRTDRPPQPVANPRPTEAPLVRPVEPILGVPDAQMSQVMSMMRPNVGFIAEVQCLVAADDREQGLVELPGMAPGGMAMVRGSVLHLVVTSPAGRARVMFDGYRPLDVSWSDAREESVGLCSAALPELDGRTVVTGIVRDENGDPMSGATVLVGDALAQTDDDGAYVAYPQAGVITVGLSILDPPFVVYSSDSQVTVVDREETIADVVFEPIRVQWGDQAIVLDPPTYCAPGVAERLNSRVDLDALLPILRDGAALERSGQADPSICGLVYLMER